MEAGTTVAPPYQCPEHREPLAEGPTLACPRGHEFRVESDVARFVSSGYAEAFGRQWQRFRLTQLDSHTGLPLSEERLRRCLGWDDPAGDPRANGAAILEAGCGAGRFTEVLLRITGAHVTSVDLSDAVVANAQNFPPSERHRIAQADIRRLPFAPHGYDYVICLGVVQHTPDPEETITALWEQVKPGGWLTIDHYTRNLSSLTRLGQLWRPVFKRLPEDEKLPAVERMVDRLLPLHRRFGRYGNVISRVSPLLTYYHRLPELRPELQREWSILDTHDALTDHYKHRRTVSQIRRLFESLGGVDIWVTKGGNGVEARMRRPA